MIRKKICFVGLENLPVLSREYNRHGIGGEQVQQTLLARAMAKRGYDVSMVVADYGQSALETMDGIKVHRAHGLSEGLPVVRFIHPRMTKLWSALKQADSDVYYVSCAGAQLGIVARFARVHRKRVIFRIAHDTDCDPKNLLIKYWRDKKIYAYGLRRADVVLAQSAQQSKALLANYGVQSRIAAMLAEPNLHDLPFSARPVDVLWVNNLRPFKRPDLALELARRLPALKFHMVGGPQPGHEAMFEELSAQAKSIPNLTFHGQVPYHDVNAFYEQAKVFVNTSDSEGFPNSYLQAWRRGAPTVVFFDPDSIISRRGLGKTARSMDEMVTEVTRLATSEPDWAAASLRCKQFMDEGFDDDRVLEPYLEALQA